VKDFELSPEDLKRIREEAEARAKDEEGIQVAAANAAASAANPSADIALPRPCEGSQSPPAQSSACPKCGFSVGWNGQQCPNCQYVAFSPSPPQGTAQRASETPRAEGQRGIKRTPFWPRLDASTPVTEFFQATFVKVMLAFWLASLVVLVAIACGLWAGPPKADSARFKAFDDIWTSAFAGVLAPLGIGVALYFVLTEQPNPAGGVSSKIKLAYFLMAVVGVFQVVVAPVLILVNTWRYLSL